MREFPLTEKQIELCDYLLSIKNKRIDHEYLESKGYDRHVDLNVSANFLIANKLISSAEPVCLTDIGTKYLKTGIIKFFKDQRRDEFLNSVTVKTFLFFVPVIISILATIISYNHSKKIENKTIDKNQINEYIDSSVQARINELNKLTIDKPIIDSLKHIE